MYFVYFLNLGEKIGNTLLFRTAYSDECWLIHRSHFLFVGLMFYPYYFLKIKKLGERISPYYR